MRRLLSLAGIIIIIYSFSSCKVSRPLPYLRDLEDSLNREVNSPDLVFQPGDIIVVTVFSDNPGATAIYNQQGGSGGASQVSSSTPGSTSSGPEYLVDKYGNIFMHTVGNVQVAGLTREQLQILLKEKFNPYLVNPYFTINTKNFKVTFLGEVNKPGIIQVNSDHVNILEALSLAGDFSIYALKEDITVIRQDKGKREYGKLDVSRASVTSSPYYYLKQNDIVIVNATPKKPGVSEQETTRKLTMAATIAGIVTSIAVLITLFR